MSKFGAKTRALEVVENIDLSNKDYIVTGGSSGIGIETVRALAKAGARVVIGARDTEKAEAVAKELRASTNNPNIEVEKLELDSLDSVNGFVKRYLDKKRPLHCLINNAGIMACPKTYTADGFEAQFGVNYMGHFALTLGLIPALIDGFKQSGKKSRVINVSSITHAQSELDFNDLNFKTREYDQWVAYSQSKLANVLFSVALTDLYKDQGIVSNALMPGGIKTNLQRHIPEEVQAKEGWFDENGFMKSILKNVEQGASTQVWAAVAPELEGVGGEYFENCGFSRQATLAEIYKDLLGYTDFAVNKDNAKKLWDLSIEWVKNPPK